VNAVRALHPVEHELPFRDEARLVDALDALRELVANVRRAEWVHVVTTTSARARFPHDGCQLPATAGTPTADRASSGDRDEESVVLTMAGGTG
jgi:hypothetical protein